MRTVRRPIMVFLLPALLTATCLAAAGGPASSGPAEASRLEEVEQLKTRVDELIRLIEQMRKEQRQQQEQIARLQAQLVALQGAPEGPGQIDVAPPEPNAADDEVARLRALAEGLAGPKPAEKTPEETVYKARGLSLQQLNPEISAAGDLVAFYRNQEGTRERSDVLLRGLELNIQSYLDPFSRMKASVHIQGDGAIDLEEVYYTHFTLLEGATIDLGRFRQPFGIVNRWHEDALDQVQYPLALRRIFGDGGLRQTGASVEWAFPEWAGAHHGLTLQVTNAANEHLFAGDALGTPSFLFRYKNFRDLSRDTYLEIGLSGLFGWNDRWRVQTAPDTVVTVHDALGTRVFGADLSVLWEPADRALYRNIEWRSEAYVLNRDLLAPDGSGRDTISAWGAYSYLQSKIAQNLIVGARLDYYQPAGRDYAALPGLSLVPLAYPADNPYRWQIGPYITWWQSEWVLFRAEYNYGWGRGMENDEHVLWFQTVFAVGPHKHERY
ncbi:MAG: hypothetical protein FJ280_13590 [Planctomycetes bacterium]|nr:hypothetical protein [Planctomycetota bacterium]